MRKMILIQYVLKIISFENMLRWPYDSFSRKMYPAFCMVQSMFDKWLMFSLSIQGTFKRRQYVQDSKTINNRSLDRVMNNPMNLSY